MKVIASYDRCSRSFYLSQYGIVFSQGNVLHCGEAELAFPAGICMIFYQGGSCVCTMRLEDGTFESSDRFFFDGSAFTPLDLNGRSATTVFTRGDSKLILAAEVLFADGRTIRKNVAEYNLQSGKLKALAPELPWYIVVSTSTHHYGQSTARKAPGICQLDHELNTCWELDETTLRRYGALDPEDPRADDYQAEEYFNACEVRRIQVLGDTLYYLYNSTMIIAIDAHTGAFKRRFSCLPAEEYGSRFVYVRNGEERSLPIYLRAMHSGRYVPELHAHVQVVDDHVIYEIDYETLTAKVRVMPEEGRLWSMNWGRSAFSFTWIDQDRVALPSRSTKEVVILNYHSLEVLDHLVLDEDNPGGYFEKCIYHDGALYIMYRPIEDRPKPNCSFYVVEVDG